MNRAMAFGAAALVLLTLFGAASKVATAHDDAAIGDLRIVGPWARATIGKGRSEIGRASCRERV